MKRSILNPPGSVATSSATVKSLFLSTSFEEIIFMFLAFDFGISPSNISGTSSSRQWRFYGSIRTTQEQIQFRAGADQAKRRAFDARTLTGKQALCTGRGAFRG